MRGKSLSGKLRYVVLGVIALAFAAAGCIRAGRDEITPGVLPPDWSAPAAPISGEPWWRELGGDALDAAVREALASNLDLLAAVARIEQAEATAREARARYFPTLDASVGYSRARVNAGPPVGTVTQGSWSASVSAAYEVDAFGRYRHGAAAAAHDAEAARLDVLALQVSIAAELADAWIEREYQVRRRAVLTRQLAIAAQQADVLAARFAYGIVTATDLVAQEQQIESFRALFPQTEVGETLARHRINLLLGRHPESHLESAAATAFGSALPAMAAAGVPADLVRTRPDVRAAEERASAADRRVVAAVAERLPSLRLTGSAGLQSESIADLLDGFVWNLAVSLVQPVFDGGRRRAAVRRAEAVLDERLLAYRRTLLVALREVEDALARERAQRDVLAAVQADLELASEALALIQRQYQQGAAEFPRVIAAEAAVARSELALLDAERGLLTHRLSLGRALGVPWRHADDSIAPANE